MAICLDCKEAAGGICFHHMVESSFDAPTEDEKTIAELRARVRELEAQLAAPAEPVLVDGPHGRPEDDALVRYLRENRAGKVRAKELIPLAEAALRSRRTLAARMAEQAMRIQTLEGELQRAKAPAVLLLKRDQVDPEVLAQVRAVRQSFRAAFVESAIEAIENLPRAKLEDLGELEAEIRKKLEEEPK